ncbi:F-box domain-containing protein [Mycena indigotica]|uniref:F-box domain-containing protein n=1 Tax=Mycena indigotica TaxID=2126181 RepID=A0A8H6T7N0_9AGAR|nr:F-box domain-containing protein [Mycena indigotica]KAF7312289.1 F-box domain-containing protein [Mycena indigotica]
MVSSILALPNDILLAIFLQLSAPDLLHLSQVCRVLHEYTLDSYLWHQVLSRQTDLPLNIDPYVDAAELSAPILQKATRDALRIDNNWKRHNPQIRQMTRIGDIENILQMQLLGSQYLVILRRHLPSLSVWRVIAKRAVLCARTDLEDSTTPLRFAASLDSRKEQILLALISTIKSGTQLSAYSVMLSDESDFSPASLKMVYNISRVDPDPFYEVHVYSHLIAIGIHSVLAPQLLIVNTVAKTRCLVHLHLPEASLEIFSLFSSDVRHRASHNCSSN